MAFPKRWYGDPANIVDDERMWDSIRRFELREKEGCGACSQNRKFGKHRYCEISMIPNKYGYCNRWSEKK